MDILTDLLGGTATALAGGGLFGLVGSLLGNWQKGRHEKARWEREELTAQRIAAEELALQKLQMKARQEETEAELALIQQQGSFDGLSASVNAQASIGDVSRWVNNVRALFRPALTLSLVAVVTWLAYLMLQGNGEMLLLLGETKISTLLDYIVTSLTFAASTAIVWWFGDRAMRPASSLNFKN